MLKFICCCTIFWIIDSSVQAQSFIGLRAGIGKGTLRGNKILEDYHSVMTGYAFGGLAAIQLKNKFGLMAALRMSDVGAGGKT